MAKRKHRNKVRRLTARERAGVALAVACASTCTTFTITQDRAFMNAVSREMQAHARATLDRAKRRRRGFVKWTAPRNGQ